jgi:SH2 domain
MKPYQSITQNFNIISVFYFLTRTQSVSEEIAGKSWYYGQISRGDSDAQFFCLNHTKPYHMAEFFCFSCTRNQSVSEEIAGKSWYYGQISRGDCDALMAERGQDGDFLVRDSESNVSIFWKSNKC